GVAVATLKAFLDSAAPESLAILDAPEPAQDDALVALNAAFVSDGVILVALADTVPSKPIEIVHLSTGEVAWFARSRVEIGAGAKLRILVSHVGPDGIAYQSNSFVGMSLAENAAVSFADL